MALLELQRTISPVDYDDVARKLIVYSRSLAKGSLSAAGGASVGEAPVLQYLSGIDGDVIPSEIAKKLKFSVRACRISWIHSRVRVTFSAGLIQTIVGVCW